MIIFISIALAAFIIVGGSFLFGHDTDSDHDGGDASHDTDAGGTEPTISVFSTKVLATLFMGFGAAGAIAMHYGASHVTASLIGVLCGILLGGLMYLVLELFYGQQSTSLVSTSAAIGCTGAVTVSIGDGTPGEVGLYLEGQYRTFSATSADGKAVPKGQSVTVIKNLGSHLVVERD
jgi:membrane protein implicated in regulation of membrane protease activity